MLRNCAFAGGFLAMACWFTLAAAAQVPASQPATQPAPAEAAETPAAAPGPAHPFTLLDIRNLALELGFEGSYDQRDVRYSLVDPYPRIEQQRDRAVRFEETFGISSTGALFDERILLYDLMARYGLSQESFHESGPRSDLSQTTHGDLLEYDVNLTFLPRGTLSGNAFAQRLDSRVPRMFLPSLDRTLERYGAGLYVNNAKFPMRFTFEHSWDELTSRTRDLNDDERRGNDTFRYEGTWQISPNQALRVEYEYGDRAEQYSGSRTRFDATRNYLTLTHTLRFGKDNKSSWENLARIQAETGNLARDNAELSSRLRLQHTDSFATNYSFQYLRDSFQQLSTETWRGEAGLTHQFAQTLTTSVQFYGLKQQADENADMCEWGGLANIAYAQDNALGRFSANLSYNHTNTETSNGDRRGIVIAESVTFRDPLSAYLAQTDINLVTLVVTDANRSRTYLPGRDYLALRIGRYTALRRVPTGQIADKQTVLVSYTYEVFDDYAIRRDRFDVRLQQDFRFGLSPYYAGSFQNEGHDTLRYQPFRERDVHRHRLGAIYRRKLWSASLEYEYNDDSIDPYQALHGNGDVVLLQRADSQLDGKATLSHFHFWGVDELEAHRTTLLDVGTSYRYLLAQNFELNASAMYRYEDDSLAGITNGVDLNGALDWRLGYFTLRFEAEYNLLDLPDSREGNTSFWIKLKRDIPLIAKETR